MAAATAAAGRRRPAGPWGEAPKRRGAGPALGGANVTSIDELLRRGRMRFGGGGGGGLPGAPTAR